jgi:hypothetical protein
MTAHDDVLLAHLRHYAHARNRDVDPEPREITITDDEAVAILQMLDAGSLGPGRNAEGERIGTL